MIDQDVGGVPEPSYLLLEGRPCLAALEGECKEMAGNVLLRPGCTHSWRNHCSLAEVKRVQVSKGILTPSC
jgi:hypothetical protein